MKTSDVRLDDEQIPLILCHSQPSSALSDTEPYVGPASHIAERE